MRFLFDHNVRHKLRVGLLSAAIIEIEKAMASYLGWSHLKNGDLLRAAEDSAFDVFVAGDRTPVHERNLSGRRLSILALSANNWPIIKNFGAQILGAICSAVPGAIVEPAGCTGLETKFKTAGLHGVTLPISLGRQRRGNLEVSPKPKLIAQH